MFRIFFILSLLTLFGWSEVTASPQIAFQRGEVIWVGKVDGAEAKKVAKGSAPDLSPDGKLIAFHTDNSSKGTVVRLIAVADVATQKVTLFRKQIPSDNCQRALWSPNGKQILFHIWADDDWHIAMINRDGSGFRYVLKSGADYNSYWSTSWAPDGKSFYAQDLRNLYQLDLDGKELKKWKLDSLFPGGSMNSGSNMSVSPDGKMLLLDIDMNDEEANMPDWDGPPPSIWSLDLAAKKATRLTPKGMVASEGCWLAPEQVLFVAQSPKEKEPFIYQIKLGERKWTRLLKDASAPSVAAETK